MKANELRHGSAYDCTMDGDLGLEKTSIVPLATNAKGSQRYVIIDARKVKEGNPALFSKLIAMSFDEMDTEDFGGGPDSEWSKYIWRFSIDEHADLYHKQSDCYLHGFLEIELGLSKNKTGPHRLAGDQQPQPRDDAKVPGEISG